MHILLIEDETATADLFGKLAPDHTITVSRTLDDANARLMRGERYDGIVVDLGLPNSTGVDTARRLRQTDIPVFAWSASADTLDLIEAYRAGVDEVYSKMLAATEVVPRMLERMRERNEIRQLLASGVV